MDIKMEYLTTPVLIKIAIIYVFFSVVFILLGKAKKRHPSKQLDYLIGALSLALIFIGVGSFLKLFGYNKVWMIYIAYTMLGFATVVFAKFRSAIYQIIVFIIGLSLIYGTSMFFSLDKVFVLSSFIGGIVASSILLIIFDVRKPKE